MFTDGGGELEINPLRTDPRYLRSRLFEDPAAGPTCLSFQYWLSAPGHSRLTATVHGAGATGRQVWHALTTEAASVWHSTAVNITTVGGPFWVSLGISVCAFAEWLVECRGMARTSVD